MNTFSFWIIDDEREIFQSLSRALRGVHTIQCWRWHPSCRCALDALRCEQAPNVFLLDVHFPDHNGVDFIPEFFSRAPHAKIVMATVDEESEHVKRALRLGAHGYLVKPFGVAKLIESCQQALRGEMPIDAKVTRHLVEQLQPSEPSVKIYGLTGAETRLLPLIVDGLIVKEIAKRAGISFHTARSHLHNIFNKLHTGTRIGLVAKILREHLI